VFSYVLDLFRATKRKHRDMRATFPRRGEVAKATSPAGFVICFFTTDSIYEIEAMRMVQSAWRLGLNVSSTAITSTGSWVRNAALKPTVLLRERQARRGPLLYVDVDAVFHRDPWPALVQMDCDVAVYRQRGRLISATILLNDTVATVDLLKEWKEQCDANPDEWDQVVLQRILDEDASSSRPRFRIAELPVAFCWIFDRLINGKPGEVFIEQLQASRSATIADRTGKKARSRRRREDRVAEIDRVLRADMPR